MLWILIVVTCFEVSTLADAQSERTTSLDEDANNNEPDHPASQPERDSNDSPAKVSTFRCSSVQAFRYSDYFEETLDFHDTHPASRGFRQRQWICIRSTRQ
ncbi:nephrin-like isoform X1 [Vespula maculifrons]|uniref:Nephrin-like isoform X1 n=1 Tax=Vespula maculifrons TaxID=7453 RepID=A0ABD2CG63_VESMC